jgi:hypothetical protein
MWRPINADDLLWLAPLLPLAALWPRALELREFGRLSRTFRFTFSFLCFEALCILMLRFFDGASNLFEHNTGSNLGLWLTTAAQPISMGGLFITYGAQIRRSVIAGRLLNGSLLLLLLTTIASVLLFWVPLGTETRFVAP